MLCHNKISNTPGIATEAATGFAKTKEIDSTFNSQNEGPRMGLATKPVYAAPSPITATMAQAEASKNDDHVKSMNNKAGEYTNAKGTKALPIDSLNAVIPVRMGSLRAMPAAAKAARATGGVTSASTP